MRRNATSQWSFMCSWMLLAVQDSWFQHLPSTYYVPGTALNVGDIKMRLMWSLPPQGAYSLLEADR